MWSGGRGLCLAGVEGSGLRLLDGGIGVGCIVCRRAGVCPALLMLGVALWFWCWVVWCFGLRMGGCCRLTAIFGWLGGSVDSRDFKLPLVVVGDLDVCLRGTSWGCFVAVGVLFWGY